MVTSRIFWMAKLLFFILCFSYYKYYFLPTDKRWYYPLWCSSKFSSIWCAFSWPKFRYLLFFTVSILLTCSYGNTNSCLSLFLLFHIPDNFICRDANNLLISLHINFHVLFLLYSLLFFFTHLVLPLKSFHHFQLCDLFWLIFSISIKTRNWSISEMTLQEFLAYLVFWLVKIWIKWVYTTIFFNFINSFGN